MARFHDTIAGWTGEDGTVALPEDWEASVTTAYDDDTAEAVSGATAAVAQSDTVIADLQAQLTEAQAANWRLLQSIPVEETTSGADDSENNGDATADDDISIDDLFS